MQPQGLSVQCARSSAISNGATFAANVLPVGCMELKRLSPNLTSQCLLLLHAKHNDTQ